MRIHGTRSGQGSNLMWQAVQQAFSFYLTPQARVFGCSGQLLSCVATRALRIGLHYAACQLALNACPTHCRLLQGRARAAPAALPQRAAAAAGWPA